MRVTVFARDLLDARTVCDLGERRIAGSQRRCVSGCFLGSGIGGANRKQIENAEMDDFSWRRREYAAKKSYSGGACSQINRASEYRLGISP
jgi:hypothetical protein